MKKLAIATLFSALSISTNAAETNPKISFDEAKKIALDAVKNSAKVVEAELEREEGEGWSYEVEVEAGGVVTEVEIDAESGKVLEMGSDD